MITVIEQSTEERKKETKELFDKIRPLLDEGYIYSNAINKVLGRTGKPYYSNGWYRDVIRYGESQGYDYNSYSGKENSYKK